MQLRTLIRRAVIASAAALVIAPGFAHAQAAGSLMIHMFVIRLAPGVTAAQKAEAVTRIKALQGKVPGLVEASIGLNESPRGQGYELGGSMKFTDAKTLAAYNDHPDHQALLKWLGPLVAQAIEMDFPAR